MMTMTAMMATIDALRSKTELDDDTDLTSIFLRNMVSDERPAPDPMGLATPSIVATHLGTNRYTTVEEWEIM